MIILAKPTGQRKASAFPHFPAEKEQQKNRRNPFRFLLLMKVLPLCGKQSRDIFGQRFGIGEVYEISGGEGDGAAFFGAA